MCVFTRFSFDEHVRFALLQFEYDVLPSSSCNGPFPVVLSGEEVESLGSESYQEDIGHKGMPLGVVSCLGPPCIPSLFPFCAAISCPLSSAP